MKWQIAEEFLEEFIAKVNRTMTPRAGKKFITHPPVNPDLDMSSPLRSRYPPGSETATPNHDLRSPTHEYMMSPSTNPPLHVETTPERNTSQRQFMPMSSPAPFYRYSSISTPATTRNDRSSPPSSGAIDLAETLVEFSSPVKLREQFIRRRSTPEEESPRPIRNGIKTLGDLQGVDLLRGFEKISSWREGSSPIKEQFETKNEHAELNIPVAENGEVSFNGNGCAVGSSSPPEEKDSQMTDIKTEGGE
jgi:hypothetical protein